MGYKYFKYDPYLQKHVRLKGQETLDEYKKQLDWLFNTDDIQYDYNDTKEISEKVVSNCNYIINYYYKYHGYSGVKYLLSSPIIEKYAEYLYNKISINPNTINKEKFIKYYEYVIRRVKPMN